MWIVSIPEGLLEFWGLPPFLMDKYFSSTAFFTEDSIICVYQWIYHSLFNSCFFTCSWFDRHAFPLFYVTGTALYVYEQDVWFQTLEYQLEFLMIVNSVWHAYNVFIPLCIRVYTHDSRHRVGKWHCSLFTKRRLNRCLLQKSLKSMRLF